MNVFSSFRWVVLVAALALAVWGFSWLKPFLVKGLQFLPINSKWVGPPKGLISASEMVASKEAFLILKEPSAIFHYKPIFDAMASNSQDPGAFVLSIPHARVYSEKGVVISPLSDLILDCTAREFGSEPQNCPVFKRLYLNRLETIKGRSALLANIGQRCYYHWMFEILPRLAALEKTGLEIDHYLTASLDVGYMRESLEFLGVLEKVKTIKFRGHIETEELLFASLPAHVPTIYVPPWVYQWLRDTFAPWRVSEKKYPEYVFVSRSKASTRRMLNEAEIFKKLESYGFSLCFLEEMSLKDQIALFSQAKMIIAPHGSGLTNLAFSNPGTTVVEIFSYPEAILPHYAALSQVLKLDYYHLVAETAPRENNDFYVNEDQLLEIVKTKIAL